MSHTWGKADIEAKLLTRDEGSPDRGEYRQAAGVFAEAYFYLSSNSKPLESCPEQEQACLGTFHETEQKLNCGLQQFGLRRARV